MKEAIVRILKKALKEKGINLSEAEIEKFIEIPPSSEMGDYSFPCFFLAEKLKDNPSQIAIELREKIGNVPVMEFDDIETIGPYINFFVNRKSFAKQVVFRILSQKDDFGKTNIGK